MKRTLILALAVLMILSAFAACRKTETPAAPKSDGSSDAASAPKTLGDVFAIESMKNYGYSSIDGKFVFVYEANGSYWRAIVPLTEEQLDAWYAIDIFDENHDEKEQAFLAPIEIARLDNLDGEKLSDEEQKAFVGKTGEELLNAGWTSEGGDPYVPEAYMSYGPFLYAVTFEPDAAYVESDDFDLEAFIRPLKVKSIAYFDLAYSAMDLPEDFVG
ncbi:MAG: hypothetical protein IJK54_08455 [Clostridia bacterium]|nr:hypothetical protein [Clostridia bacterium]